MTDLAWDASTLLLAEAVPPSVAVPSVAVPSLELVPDTCLYTEPDEVTDPDFKKNQPSTTSSVP